MSYLDFATIDAELCRLGEELSKSSLQKRKLETELGTLNNRVRSAGYGGLSRDEFTGICRRQNAIRSLMTKLEETNLPIRNEKKKWQLMRDELSAKWRDELSRANKNGRTEELPWERIVELRDRWQRFAEDATRINSMRLLSASFARELTAILEGKESNAVSLLTTTLDEQIRDSQV